MRLSIALLLASLAGVLVGGALTGMLGLGLCIIFDSLCVGVYALLREAGDRARPSVHEVPTLGQILERARGAA